MYIGAADLCAAPYAVDRFDGGELTVGSLKISEYLACARPVLATRAARMEDLVSGGAYGLLVDNDEAAYRQVWRNLLGTGPLREIEQRIFRDLMDGTLRRRLAVVRWSESAAMLAGVAGEVLRDTRWSAKTTTVRSWQ